MDIGLKVSGGFISLLCLGVLLGAMIIPLQAGEESVHLVDGAYVLSGSVQPVSRAGPPTYSPPAFMHRHPPISQRPFAQPFIDRSPPVSERPLAPIGGGAQVAPHSIPFMWCQGQWVRVASPWHSCPSR